MAKKKARKEAGTGRAVKKAPKKAAKKAPKKSAKRAAKKTVKKAATKSPAGQVVLRRAVRIFDEVAAETQKACWQPRSAMTTHLVCMRAAGWKDADYDTLMTVSGFGISFAYHRKEKFWVGWVPPPGADERIARATGFGWQWLHLRDAESAWRLLKRTIRAKRPIRAPYIEELVFAGHQEANRKADRKVLVLCVPFAHPGKWWSWDQFQHWFDTESHGFLARHTKRVEQAPPRETAEQVVKTIVQWALHHPLSDNKDYGQVEFGLAGIEAYAADIEDLELTSDDFAAGWLGCHAIYPQWTARKCTANYLKGAAGRFPTKVAARIRAAVKEYNAAYKAWQGWEKHLGRDGKAPKNAWRTKTHRLAGAKAVRRAAEHEKAAIIELAQALAAM